MIVGAVPLGGTLSAGGVPEYPQANREMLIPISNAHRSKLLGFLKWQTSLIRYKSNTEDSGAPANARLRATLYQGVGKFTLASSSTKTQSLELGAVKLWVPLLGNVPMLVAAPVDGLYHHA